MASELVREQDIPDFGIHIWFSTPLTNDKSNSLSFGFLDQISELLDLTFTI
jgi:hypothetical protein